MSAAAASLYAVGEQNAYTDDKPDGSFWRPADYAHHPKFSWEMQELPFAASADFEREVSVEIPFTPDLIGDTWLKVELTPLPTAQSVSGIGDGAVDYTYVDRVGFAMLEKVEFWHGPSKISEMDADVLNINNELTTEAHKRQGRDVGKFATAAERFAWSTTAGRTSASYCEPLYVRLPFWFTRDMAHELPIVAMAEFQPRVVFRFRPWRYCVATQAGRHNVEAAMTHISATRPTMRASLVVKYRYFKDEVRVPLGESAHSQLINVWQLSNEEAVPDTTGPFRFERELSLRNLIKALYIIVKPAQAVANKAYFNYAVTTTRNTVDGLVSTASLVPRITDPVAALKFSFGGQDFSDEMPGEYYRAVLPYDRHTAVPRVATDEKLTEAALASGEGSQAIYVFTPNCLFPEAAAPSGDFDASAISPIKMTATLRTVQQPALSAVPASVATDDLSGVKGGTIKVIALAYNRLVIEGGAARVDWL